MRRLSNVRDQHGCARFFLGAMLGHLQETYPYEKHFMKITNNNFYVEFPLNHAPRMRPQNLDLTQERQNPKERNMKMQQ